ncbi:winged helix-turn-helix domain-containing protein [Larkinella terrae]|uniref:Transcriptional regulator n=1 Tax=Larkinella terrae TaxID=2025311 RepID=A0A7K0EQX9_9BACT|nr:winged helix-turn-helix domain-containing protein [Larkinella terrae]MRS64214.1 transcriptional regulator [Larkinella terrae]
MGKVTRIIALSVALLTALLFVQFVRSTPTSAQTEKNRFAEKVNLALRRTAHQLLAAAGDSTSQIPPVQQTDATTFLIRLDHPFDYGKLPGLLQQSLQIHSINETYDVAVLNCANGKIQLGYSVLDVQKKQNVACSGRVQTNGCYNLQIRFATPEAAPQTAMNWWMLAIGSVLTALVFTVFRRSSSKEGNASSDAAPVENPKLHFGNSSLDMANLKLWSNDLEHDLTYREAKLLRLFAGSPNQLLERDFILKSVWEDEGIIVGRSVDVFVSRLRKLLQDDPTVKIAAVHGVGYRLEIRPI